MTTTAPDPATALLRLADPVPAVPPVTPHDVARVVADARSAAGPARTPTSPRPRRRRPLLVAVGVAVAAGAASVAVVVLPGGERVGVRPPAAVADPVTVLRAAATTATAQPFTAPRPDQFVYVASAGYRAWFSVDGTHDGLVDAGAQSVVPGCRDGMTTQTGNGVTVTVACTPTPAYRPDLPADPVALRAAVVAEAGGDATNPVAKQVLPLLEFELLPPATRGALFTVVSTYPGLTTRTDGVPPGTVGVSWSFGGGSVTLLFGADDHGFRGTLDPTTGGVSGLSSPVVVDAVGRTS